MFSIDKATPLITKKLNNSASVNKNCVKNITHQEIISSTVPQHLLKSVELPTKH